MSADAPEITSVADDERAMATAIAQAERARFWSRPNPWVGAVVVVPSGATFTGFTEPPGRRHAERVALDAAGAESAGATVYVTLEPCAHHGRTPPCADALIDAGVARVVVGVSDPDPHVAGQGIERLRRAGIRVDVGAGHEAVAARLAPVPAPPPHRPAARCGEAGRHDGRPYRRRRRLQPVDHRPRGPRRCASTPGRERRHPGRSRYGPRRRSRPDRAGLGARRRRGLPRRGPRSPPDRFGHRAGQARSILPPNDW